MKILHQAVTMSMLLAACATLGPDLLTKDENGNTVTDPAPKTKTAAEQALDVKKMLDTAVDSVKAIAEDALGKAKAGEELTSDMKNQIDEAITKMNVTDETLKTINQKMARSAGGFGIDAQKSAGTMFAEGETFSAFQKKGEPMLVSQTMRHEIKTITSLTTDAPGSMGAHIQPDRVQSPMSMLPQRRLFLRDLIASGQTSSNSIEFVQETGFVNNANVVAEGGVKPRSDLQSELVDAKVRKIAHIIGASMEILNDVPALSSMIDSRLRYGLEVKLEGQILNGDGTGQNLNGIMTQATTFTAPTGVEVEGETKIDRLRIAILQATLAEYPVDAQVINPIDWASIELTKDNEGRYIIGNPVGSLQPTLWSRPVVATQAMAVGNFLVGAFSQGAQLFDRMLAAILISTENKDNFEKNLVDILAEIRVALAVYRPEAFVKGTLPAVAAG